MSASNEPVIKFRNYTPQYTQQRSHETTAGTDKVSSNSTEPTADSTTGQTTEREVLPSENVNTVKNTSRRDVPIDPIKQELLQYSNTDQVNIIPKKPNSDLKNMVASKLEKLQRRTQLAIVELLREKIRDEERDGDDGDDDN
jgi:coiled-coil domain-containing protein 12